MSRCYSDSLCLSRDYLQYIGQLIFTDSVCSKQFWEQHSPFCATQKIIIIVSTMTLLQLMGIFLIKGTSRKYKDNLERKCSIQVHTTICTDGAVTVHPKPTYVKHWVEKQFWEVYHAGVQFQWKKNYLQTTMMRVSWFQLPLHKANSGGMEATVLAGFPMFAAALYLCPKLVNLSRSGCLHINGLITCNLLNEKNLES